MKKTRSETILDLVDECRNGESQGFGYNFLKRELGHWKRNLSNEFEFVEFPPEKDGIGQMKFYCELYYKPKIIYHA